MPHQVGVTQLPLVQVAVPQPVHGLPPVPQDVLFWPPTARQTGLPFCVVQQPLHELLLHTQSPFTHALVPQLLHASPAVPHVVWVLVRQTLPEQHPDGHDAPLQTQVPFVVLQVVPLAQLEHVFAAPQSWSV